MASNDMECLVERKVPDATSDGLIEAICLKNFMCHSELDIDKLSKNKITFITGPNGSGKSAVLTSLMLGFGGRANITCRGHSTKGFVKEGKPYADIVIKLRNDTNFGRFQYEKFGKFIFIKRRLTGSGHSQYELSDERQQVVYKTAGALKKLMSFFDIRPENPLMLLTQENAKKLLFDASEKDMYKFFRAGTGLDDIQLRMTNLQKEIDRVRQNWIIRRDCFEKRKKDIEALKKRYNRYREVENFQQRELELTQSLQWVDLAQKERELQNTRAEADRLAKQRTDVEKRKDEAHRCIEDMQTRVNEQAQAVQALAEEVDHAKEEVQAAQARRSEASNDTKKVDAEVQFRQKKLAQLNAQKNDVIRAIDAAQRKLRAKQGADAEKQRSEAKLVDLRRQKADLEESLARETAGREDAQRRLAECRQSEQRLRENEFSLRRDLEQLAKQRAAYESVKANSSSRFGRQMPNILREIENAVRVGAFKRPPIGPLGRYVSLVGDESWAPAIETALGKHFSSFIVCCPADRQTLHDIFRKKVGLHPSNQDYPQVIMSDRPLGHGRVDISRTRASCPNSNLLSFFDLAEITDDDVFNFLLELALIEIKLFAEDAQAALDLVNNGRCINVMEVIGKNLDRVRYFHNTKGSSFQAHQYPVRTNYLMKDVGQQMADIRERESETNVRYKEIRTNLEAASREVGAADAAVRRIETAASQINNRMRSVDSEIERLSRLASMVLEEPNDVTLLEEDLQRKQAEIEAFQTSQEQVVLDAKIRAANDQRKAADKLFEEARANLARKEQAHEQGEEQAGAIHRSAADARRKLPGIREQFERLTDQWNALKTRVDEQEASCKETLNTLLEQYGTRPRTRTNESRRDIEQQLKDLREKIADRERIDRTGFDSIPERQKTLETEQQELEQRDLQLQSLEQIVTRRIEGFPNMVSRTARHIELWFSRMSYTKDLNSQLKFDHTNGTLAFRVSSVPATNQASKQRRMTSSGASQTVSLSQTSTTSSRSQTPQAPTTTRSIKTLSGGERSMSTVFFLLSLWEHSESPVKGMDEFDVFLDGENREQAINLIVKFSPSMAGQFFLLSPCNVNSLGGPATRNQVIVLKKGGGYRGQESLSQTSVEPPAKKRHSRARLTQSQTTQDASTSQISESISENREEDDEEVVAPSRKHKRRCKMEPTSEEEEEAA